MDIETMEKLNASGQKRPVKKLDILAEDRTEVRCLELLPGIEEFLVQILPQEKLSSVAEERRQYFVERLDILKLPPSLPPRAGKRLSVELLEESEENCGTPADLVPELSAVIPEMKSPTRKLSEVEKDFAAEQRKISRNMHVSVSSEKDGEDIEDSDSAKGVKVYDDIDPSESTKTEQDDDEDDDDINALYEIPVARQQPVPTSEDSLSQPADISSLATQGSVDDVNDDVLGTPSPEWQPPPLPPRTKKKESESAESRVSTNSLDGKPQPPELPFRPPLPRRNEVYARSEKSDKSEKSEKSDVSDGDSTSYESFDENENDNEFMSKLNVKLPKRSKKKTKTSTKLLSSKTRSSSAWEINKPFKLLENVIISGEMLHKGKLSWNRRVVAISNGCMALYKPDKETRPVFVIPLSGCSATLGETLGRKGFEMKMTHMNGESYTFAVDFKEWANQWCEHINNAAQGVSLPACQQHLARTFSGGGTDNPAFGSKGNLSNSNSNLSVSSEGMESDDSSKPRLRANKVMRMGSFAFRATQFFENLGKKSTSKRKSSSLSSPTDAAPDFKLRDGIQEESSLSSSSTGFVVTPSSDAPSPVFDDSFRHSSVFSSPDSAQPPPLPPTPPPPIPTNIKQKGYLNIFSSFNKRRWGKRWCLVRENMFECYRTQTSQLCELNFLLKNCVLRQALNETNSPLSLMLLENNREKITVEPPSKEELSQWLRVLMVETATEAIPAGLEEYFVEVDENNVDDLTSALEAEYSDIVGVSVLKSWKVGSVPILGDQEKGANGTEEKDTGAAADLAEEKDKPEPDDTLDDAMEAEQSEKYLYSAVIKRPSTATLVQLGEEGERKTEDDVKEDEGEKQQNMPRFTDNLAVYNANKNTTDSGFYSVKETNSDSESGSELKTDIVSPTQESCPTASSQEGPALPKCNNSAEEISDCAVASGGTQAYEEEEEEESALEKTMTSDDFKENVDNGREGVCSETTVTKSDLAVSGNDGNENGVAEASSNPEKDVSVPNCSKDKGSENVVSLAENHVCPETVDSQVPVSEDGQQRDKPKRKKKKGKSKKNKQKQREQEQTPVENSAQDNADSCSLNAKSSQSKKDNDNPEVAANPACNNSSVEHAASGSSSDPSKHGNSAEGEKQLNNAVCEPSTSTVSSEAGAGENGKEPKEDEVITDLRERIGRLREKLVQIKRKRIAVRDKRVRAFSPEERNMCDKEYLVLESECKDTAAIIHNLEEELKAATEAANKRS